MTCPLETKCTTFDQTGHWVQKESCDLCNNYKPAYLWVIGGWFGLHPNDGPPIAYDLYFSSPEKFRELLTREMDDDEALIRVWVPKDFDNWDYIPDCY